MMAAEFLIEMGVGILNKVVPQISIFVINIQMKLIVGTGLLVLLFAPTGEFIEDHDDYDEVGPGDTDILINDRFIKEVKTFGVR